MALPFPTVLPGGIDNIIEINKQLSTPVPLIYALEKEIMQLIDDRFTSPQKPKVYL